MASNGVSAAKRSSLSEQVRNHILENIATGKFAPGDRVIEARIAEDLGVSTIPVREAIRDLVARRILEYVVHFGARVREVSMAETADALKVKAALEALASRLAGPGLYERIAELARYIQGMLASASRRDFVVYQEQNQLFHRTIVKASGNQILLNLWDSLAFEVRTRFIMDYLRSVDPSLLAREHEGIMAAIGAKDAEHAAVLLTQHADHLVSSIEAQMKANAADRSVGHEEAAGKDGRRRRP
ncbi:MAG TPA: GntR family transcriptional regulator [Spirochaetia bacterium]|nr:GntR family transcriptional regulator [Spirochaetia bacterium]